MGVYIPTIYQGETDPSKEVSIGLDYATAEENYGVHIIQINLSKNAANSHLRIDTVVSDTVADAMYKVRDAINNDINVSINVTASVDSFDERYVLIQSDDSVLFTFTPEDEVQVVSYLPESFYGWGDGQTTRVLPPLAVRKTGWVKDQHPPARWWNWAWNTMQMFINHMSTTMTTLRNQLEVENMVGELRTFAGDGSALADSGLWVQCDGRSLSKVEYEELYTAIGDIYGSDTETFQIPDLRGRSVIGSGTYTENSVDTEYTLGSFGGVENRTITVSQMPNHTHSVKKREFPVGDGEAGYSDSQEPGSSATGPTEGVTGYPTEQDVLNIRNPYVVSTVMIKVKK